MLIVILLLVFAILNPLLTPFVLIYFSVEFGESNSISDECKILLTRMVHFKVVIRNQVSRAKLFVSCLRNVYKTFAAHSRLRQKLRRERGPYTHPTDEILLRWSYPCAGHLHGLLGCQQERGSCRSHGSHARSNDRRQTCVSELARKL